MGTRDDEYDYLFKGKNVNFSLVSYLLADKLNRPAGQLSG